MSDLGRLGTHPRHISANGSGDSPFGAPPDSNGDVHVPTRSTVYSTKYPNPESSRINQQPQALCPLSECFLWDRWYLLKRLDLIELRKDVVRRSRLCGYRMNWTWFRRKRVCPQIRDLSP